MHKRNSIGFGRKGFYNPVVRLLRNNEIVEPIMRHFEYSYIASRVRYSLKGLTADDSRRGSVRDHLIHDLFCLYYRADDRITLYPEYNRTKSRLLNELYNASIKIVSEGSYLKSFYFTSYMIAAFLNALEDSKLTGDEVDKLLEQLTKGRKDNIKAHDNHATKILNKLFNSDKTTRDLVQRAEAEALEQSEKASKLFGSGVDKSLESIGDVLAAERVLNFASTLTLLDNNVKDFFDKIMRHAISQFSYKDETKGVSIFEAEVIDELVELEFLADDILSTLHLEDVNTIERIPNGKFVLYVDASGSMGSGIDSHRISRSNRVLAMALAWKLFKLDLIDEVRYFTSAVHDPIQDKFEMLSFSRSGGTSFSAVIKDSLEHGRHALVITDGQESPGHYAYNPNLYWLGVGEARFDCFGGSDDSKKYLLNKQCMLYDTDSGLIKRSTIRNA